MGSFGLVVGVYNHALEVFATYASAVGAVMPTTDQFERDIANQELLPFGRFWHQAASSAAGAAFTVLDPKADPSRVFKADLVDAG